MISFRAALNDFGTAWRASAGRGVGAVGRTPAPKSDLEEGTVKRTLLISFGFGIAIGLALALSSRAIASPSCTDWMRQDNGCSQRVCVDDNGNRYCEEICPGGTSHRVRC